MARPRGPLAAAGGDLAAGLRWSLVGRAWGAGARGQVRAGGGDERLAAVRFQALHQRPSGQRATGEAWTPALDFDLAPPSAPAPEPAPAPAAEPPKEEKPSFDFDLSGLDFPGTSKPAAPAESAPAAPSMDLADLSLDVPGSDAGGGGEAVGTKLELAKAYLEIGDKDGAREILQEVAKEGSAAQKEEAQKLISSL